MSRVAVVTGANRGLGLAAVEALAEKGFRVLLTARALDKATAAAAPLRARALDVRPHALDVSSDASVEAFVAALRRDPGHVDVLVNNAGAIFEGRGSSGADVSPALVLEALNTNTLGAYRLLRALVPLMNAVGYGRVVNVSSGMGALTDMSGNWPAYRISKTALNAVTRVFAAETHGDVKINSVCPGWVRTDMGGPGATRSIAQGVAGIVWAATLGADGPSGGFFRDGKPIDW